MTANSPSGIEGGDSMFEQTRAVFQKIKALVEAAGGTMNDIVKMTGFITDIRQREDYLRARQPFFTADPPASTLVEITALAVPGLIIEVEVMAIIGSSGTGRSRGAPRLRRGATKAEAPPRKMGKLDGKVVVVTGASRGIGAEIAKLFAAEGGRVVCAARTLKEGDHQFAGSLEAR